MKRIIANVCVLIFTVVVITGCGYTTHSVLPDGAQSIYIDNIKNMIEMTQEVSDKRIYVLYRPGIELDVTREIIDRFILDGNISVKDERHADLVMRGELVDFLKEVLRYDANDNPIEYRIKIVTNIKLEDTRVGKVLWQEDDFIGEATYRTGGEYASSESRASIDAIKDLARRVVERTVEGW
jgi:hypothetical protein